MKMDKLLQDLWQHADVFVGRLVGAAAILVVGIAALRYLVAPLRRLMERGRLEPATVSFLANSLRGLLLVVIVIGALQQLGVETTSLLTVLAAGGLAVALSLQNTLNNFTAGVLLLSFRLLRVGDLIESGSMRGRVAEILPFHIILATEDHQALIVPNSLLTGNGFCNHSAHSSRRAQWTLPLRPGDDLAVVKAALCERLLADVRVLREPAPRAFLQEWAEDRPLLAVQAWAATADYRSVQEDLLETLGLALTELRAKEKPQKQA
jgi:small conductance mechanosensitive channel